MSTLHKCAQVTGWCLLLADLFLVCYESTLESHIRLDEDPCLLDNLMGLWVP